MDQTPSPESPDPGAQAQPPVRVLLIDDNRGFGYFIRDILMRQERGRFELAEATALAPGLEILRRNATDVVLLDLGLPDSGGFATFLKTQAEASDVPIIILTVLDDDALAMRAMGHGAQDYLVKGAVDRPLLVRTVRYAIERARSEKALRELSRRLLQLQDEERRRIARALHDTVAQNLAALSMNLAHLHSLSDQLPEEAGALLADCLASSEQCSEELRTTSYLLHPPLLDELGLGGAFREYADGFAGRSRIRVDLELPPDLQRLPKDIETTLFRVMQEALANTHRHASSKTASVRLALQPGQVRLDVGDSGCGIPEHKLSAAQRTMSGIGVGIAGMRERVRQLGGRLEIATSPTGTTVSASIPLPPILP